MKNLLHQGLTYQRWFKLSMFEQLANFGMDIERTIQWKKRGDLEPSKQAFYRALELIDFTVVDPKNRGGRLREILRVREALVDHFVYDNIYNTTDELWQKHFYSFNYAAALQRGK